MHDCVIPAAGASARMRRGGGFKPLLPFAAAPKGGAPIGGAPIGDSPTGEKTLVETAVDAALAALCRVVLVVGYRGEEIAALFAGASRRAALEDGRLIVVRNPRWEEGLVGSIQAALPAVAGEAFFVAHADMPFVAPGHYAALASAREAWITGLAPIPKGEAVFFASWRGQAGHPVLIPSAWIPELAAFAAGEKLRPFFEDRPRVLVETGPGALCDIDTPLDYERAMESCARK
jgi:molybdenum cofactor cytidylyltransferase